VFVATGNNLTIADDLGRRTIMARLDFINNGGGNAPFE
jgi:hypothetical protein